MECTNLYTDVCFFDVLVQHFNVANFEICNFTAIKTQVFLHFIVTDTNFFVFLGFSFLHKTPAPTSKKPTQSRPAPCSVSKNPTHFNTSSYHPNPPKPTGVGLGLDKIQLNRAPTHL